MQLSVLFGNLEDNRMVASVQVIRLKPGSKENEKISTKPMILKGTPEEIDIELVNQLEKRKEKILEVFTVDAQQFDESLDDIKKEEPKKKTGKKSTVPEKKKEGKKTPLMIAQEYFEDIEDDIDIVIDSDKTPEAERELRKLQLKIGENKAACKLLPNRVVELNKKINAALLDWPEQSESVQNKPEVIQPASAVEDEFVHKPSEQPVDHPPFYEENEQEEEHELPLDDEDPEEAILKKDDDNPWNL